MALLIVGELVEERIMTREEREAGERERAASLRYWQEQRRRAEALREQEQQREEGHDVAGECIPV